MTIQLIVDNVEIPVKHIRFSDGSSNVKLEVPQRLIDDPPLNYYSVTVEPTTPVDNYLWEILQVVDAVRQTFDDEELLNKHLCLPYLPHGRADRVFETGNGLPLRLFLDSIMGWFDNIFLTDPHSNFYQFYERDYGVNFVVTSQQQCFMATVRDVQSGDVLVSPDKGAVHKIEELHRRLHNRGVATFLVKADKKRDVSTGRIIETVLPGDADVKGKRCIIVDDIGDGNGTFVPLAIKLKEAGAERVELYVTHLIAAKGLGNLFGIVDKIHAYQVVGNYINMEDVRRFNEGVEPRKF